MSFLADCIDKIRSIKRAQKENFLPLVVIRSILEKNAFDYGALDSLLQLRLDSDVQSSQKAVAVPKVPLQKNIPLEVLDIIARREWGGYTSESKKGENFIHDPVLLNFLSTLNGAGASWEEFCWSRCRRCNRSYQRLWI